jgi:hypothetical protein
MHFKIEKTHETSFENLVVQINNWANYLEHGVHSGNRSFDFIRVEKLIEEAQKINPNYMPPENLIMMINQAKSNQQSSLCQFDDYT